jgi:hypothetical protein
LHLNHYIEEINEAYTIKEKSGRDKWEDAKFIVAIYTFPVENHEFFKKFIIENFQNNNPASSHHIFQIPASFFPGNS